MSAEQDEMKLITITATIDTICPWCYLGYAKVNKAIKQVQDEKLPVRISLKFAPFQLAPDLTDKPIKKLEYLSGRFGPSRSAQIESAMSQKYLEAGLGPLSPNGSIRQTIGSHRLIWKATQVNEELGVKTMEAVEKGYFIGGEDIGDVDNFLSKVALEQGLFESQEKAVEWFKSEDGVQEYQKAVKDAKLAGITGVPFWTIDNKWAISGAQDSSTFYQIFKGIAQGSFKPERAD